MAPTKRYGLRLITGGAANEPHVIAGLPGYYRPDVPTPVGEEGEISLDDARKAVKDRSDALELVEIPTADVRGAIETAEADLAAGRNEFPQARRDGRASDDLSRAADEQKAIQPKESE